MALERIIITFEQDGSFRGASATDFGGLPVDLTHVDLAKIIPDLNTAALSKADAMEAEKAVIEKQATDLLAYKDAMVSRVSEVLQSGDPAQFEALAVDFLTPAQDKLRAEKMAQLEALQAEIAALQ